jgi:hypothetical protein
MLYDYIRQDTLLGKFFEPFIFEKTAATNKSTQNIYLDKVKDCNIYLGIYGETYGNEDEEGVSPTEREYDLANRCVAQGLKKLKFIQEADFRTTLYRSYTEENAEMTAQVRELMF